MIRDPKEILQRLCVLPKEDDGAAATEWAVLASGIIAVAIFGITSLGQNLAQLFGKAVGAIGAYF